MTSAAPHELLLPSALCCSDCCRVHVQGAPHHHRPSVAAFFGWNFELHQAARTGQGSAPQLGPAAPQSPLQPADLHSVFLIAF